MNVLVVGSAGRVGTMVVHALRERHQVRVADRQPGAGTDDGSLLSVMTGHDALGLPRGETA